MAHDTALSRRSLMAISAAALAGTAAAGTSGALAQAAPPALAASDPDAPLIELCAQWEALRAAWYVACEDFQAAEEAAVDKHRHLGMPALWSEVHRDPAYREADQRSSAITEQLHPLYRAIGQTRAVTMKGVMAKARVTASECLDGGIEEEATQYNEGVTPHYMALTLVRDLLALNSAGKA